METIIILKTWGCPCGYNQDSEPLIDTLCPRCGKFNIERITDDSKKIIVTIAGEENIDQEIIDIEDRKSKGTGFGDPDLSTKEKKNSYKKERMDEVKEAIRVTKLKEDTLS